MNEAMNNTVSFIQIAQLKDELSEAYKTIDLINSKFETIESDKQTAVSQAVQSYEDEILRMKNDHQREMEQVITMFQHQISDIKDSHKKDLIAKELEIQHLRESKENLAETSLKAIEDITSKATKLEGSLSENISRNLWYKQKHWGKNSEQARLLQNRNPLTRREEKALFMMGVIPDTSQICSSELDTGRRKNGKSKKIRLDYSKNKPYTSTPYYIKLEDYFSLSEGERFKTRNGVIEKRLKRMVVMVPAHFVEVFVEVATVRCHGEERDTYVLENQVIPGVPFDAEMISFILTEHYCFNTTWANIAKKLSYYGVCINDSTLGDIAHRCIAYMKNEMEEVWQNELYTTHYWMLDETTVLVGVKDKESNERSYLSKYLWGIRANKLKLSWFIYEDGSRGRKVIQPYLDKFKGCFTTDGYVVYKLYDKLSDADQIRCACMTHIRRLFVEALHENRSLMSWFINKIKKLFAIESWCKEQGLTGVERANVRVNRSSFIMQEIENKFNFYINNGSFHKLGKMTQAALKYIKNEWKAMKNVLKFGDAELSNNLCEQMMRHIKINLKNSQNIGSEKAAGNFCFMYSLVESCGFNALSPMRYISHLLKTLPTLGPTVERRNLLPCYCQL